MRTYVAFDLGISLGEVSAVTYHPEGDDPPDNVFTWRVICDQGKVTIRTRENKDVVEIGRAIWTRRRLDQRWCKVEGYPNDHQWNLVRNALDGLDVAGAPRGTVPGGSPQAQPGKPSTNQPLVFLGVGVAVVTGAVLIGLFAGGEEETQPAVARKTEVTPTPPPPPAPPPPPVPLEVRITQAASVDEAFALVRPALERSHTDGVDLIARYAVAKLRWDDVATATTSIGLVLKDASVERGKRLCATGTLQAIERGDLEQRAVYRGTLATREGDSVQFLAVGSTGTLVRRDEGTLCGVVLGKQGDTVQLVGMFDLPENRAPAVEREVP